MDRIFRRIGVALAFGLASCGGEEADDVACTADIRAGISVLVFDAATGSPAACGAQVTITAAGFSETHSPSQSCDDRMAIAGVFERTGSYTVVVSKAGYQDLTINNVVVTADRCHVHTARLEARLSR
jgi:hypothetical protein